MKGGIGASGWVFLDSGRCVCSTGLLEWQRTEMALSGGVALYKCRKNCYSLYFRLLQKASGIASTLFSKEK